MCWLEVGGEISPLSLLRKKHAIPQEPPQLIFLLQNVCEVCDIHSLLTGDVKEGEDREGEEKTEDAETEEEDDYEVVDDTEATTKGTYCIAGNIGRGVPYYIPVGRDICGALI